MTMRGVAAAASFARKLGPRSARFDADPWRVYPLGSGREADPLMAAMWAHAAK